MTISPVVFAESAYLAVAKAMPTTNRRKRIDVKQQVQSLKASLEETFTGKPVNSSRQLQQVDRDRDTKPEVRFLLPPE